MQCSIKNCLKNKSNKFQSLEFGGRGWGPRGQMNIKVLFPSLHVCFYGRYDNCTKPVRLRGLSIRVLSFSTIQEIGSNFRSASSTLWSPSFSPIERTEPIKLRFIRTSTRNFWPRRMTLHFWGSNKTSNSFKMRSEQFVFRQMKIIRTQIGKMSRKLTCVILLMGGRTLWMFRLRKFSFIT